VLAINSSQRILRMESSEWLSYISANSESVTYLLSALLVSVFFYNLFFTKMADLCKRVHSMLGQNNNLKNNDIVKHFVQEGFKRRTIYGIMKRYEIGLPAEDLPRSGRPTCFKGKA
ncbi:unnamed protein product, partial [Rotaria magnacalcarata]